MSTPKVIAPSPYGSMRQRALTILNGGIPERLPFITRLETWYKSHARSGTLPERFRGMSLGEVHRAVGVGQLLFAVPYAYRLKGVDVRATFNGEPHFHETAPVLENFPGMWDIVPTDRPGTTCTELITPVGKLTLTHMLLPEHVYNATDPYLKEPPIKDESDLRTVEYILERAEIVTQFDKMASLAEEVGEHGLLVPLLHRIPFQQALLEYFGEMPLFFWLHDKKALVMELLSRLDEQLVDALGQLEGFAAPYVEFPDNLDGIMTNPRLFREHCLPAYQKYTAVLHAQGKKVGSHTDGNVRPLLTLLAKSGLDVCESFSPAPLTACTFEEAAAAWQAGPTIWGAIPTPVLEERTSEAEFQAYLDRLFATIRSPLILGGVDLIHRHNLIERVEAVARRVDIFDLRNAAGISVRGEEG
jgi:hypothetical protein